MMAYCGSKLPLGVRLWNTKKIQWAMDNVITPQCYNGNIGEHQVRDIIEKNGYKYEYQYPVVIADENKVIKRIFLADFLVERKVIVEVDGCYHDHEFDKVRDELTSKLGFKTLRIPRNDNHYDEQQIIKQIDNLLEV